MFRRPGEIQLSIDAVNPRQVAYDAMKLVPNFLSQECSFSSKEKVSENTVFRNKTSLIRGIICM